MKKQVVTVKAESGIHARPAGLLVKAAGAFTSTITLEKGEKTADAKRLLGILALAIKQGEEITICADGADEDAAIEAIKNIIEAE